MALARTYYSVNGEIIGEHRQGEANSRDYIRDSLGNVTAVYQNDWEIAEAIYKPYGEMFGNWNFSDYRFGWNGAHGYRRTRMAWTTHYVRARHYSQIGANWTTRDPLWPREMPYGYVNGMVMSRVDPSGLLSFEYYESPHNLEACGTGISLAKWILELPKEQNGWIVQKVTFTADLDKCSGIPLHHELDITYWEAWKVVDGKKFRCFGDDDIPVSSTHDDEYWHKDLVTCIEGNFRWCAEYAFYTGDLGKNFRCGGVSNAGPLKSTVIEPIWWNSLSKKKRSMVIDFSCCKGNHDDCFKPCAGGVEIWNTTERSCK